MTNQIFNINVDEEKLMQFKHIALEQGIRANDLIEIWIDKYIKGENKSGKSRWKSMSFNTQLPGHVLEELEDKGVYFTNHVILQSLEHRYSYTREHTKEFGIEREIDAKVYVLDLETDEIYIVRYEWLMRDRENYGCDKITVSCDKSAYSKQDVITAIEYIWSRKDEYQDVERQVCINDVGVRFMPTHDFNNCMKDTILINNFKAIELLKERINTTFAM